ncbi:MAG: thiamine pyrophosphate-binding protein [Chloroflexi bacterium]|nr:thiamine pyrophosphate-binding protein [Chloroflexota bacterium]
MAKVTGAQLFARALRAEGIDTVFTLVGDHILPICNTAVDEGIRFVDTRHESAAVHMADAWARVTGGPGVGLVTGGPGHANCIAGLSLTYLVESPVIQISGMADIRQEDMAALQHLDQVEMARPVTKAAWMVRDIRRIPEYVARCFKTALGERPGPVHLSIPIELQEDSIDEDEALRFAPAEYRNVGRPHGDPKLIARAVELLAGAERPVIVVGAAARFSVEQRALEQLAETLRVPVFTVEHARGLISDEHPLCFGYADFALNEVSRRIGQADVVLLLGKKIDFRIGFGRPPAIARDTHVIQIENSEAEIGRNRGVQVGIVAHLGAAVEQLTAAAKSRQWSEKPWVDQLRAARTDFQAKLADLGKSADVPLHPMRVTEELRDLVSPGACLTFDGGDFVQWPRAALPARTPGRWMRLGPLGHLGAALPFGIAAKLALGDEQVITFIGDGGVGFYFMEFDTAIRHNIPLLVILGNDSTWGIDHGFQIAYYGRAVGTDLRPIRYDRLVQEMGGHGEYVQRAEELRPAVERALASGKVACVNVEVGRIRSPLADAMIARKTAAAARK